MIKGAWFCKVYLKKLQRQSNLLNLKVVNIYRDGIITKKGNNGMGRKTTLQKRTSAKVHPELKGLNIKINPLGQVEYNYEKEEINNFLNRHVYDKKLERRS